MKRLVFCIALALGILLVSGCGGMTGEERNSSRANISVSTMDEPYIQEVLELTNEFRTGNDANWWNANNTERVTPDEPLETLVLDTDLCRAAQIRAAEIVDSFSHTRPDRRDCFSVLDDLSISRNSAGENIAAGNAGANATFVQWKEDDKPYSGQGHRRNMLGDYTKIGIARAHDPDSRYKYYWVMILTK